MPAKGAIGIFSDERHNRLKKSDTAARHQPGDAGAEGYAVVAFFIWTNTIQVVGLPMSLTDGPMPANFFNAADATKRPYAHILT